jgi:hypothetical protein
MVILAAKPHQDHQQTTTSPLFFRTVDFREEEQGLTNRKEVMME